MKYNDFTLVYSFFTIAFWEWFAGNIILYETLKPGFMVHKKKIIILSVLTIFVIACSAVTKLPRKKERNLQVLPKDISDPMLDSIMQTYNKALGVTCNFCHSAATAVSPSNPGDTLDYALDNSMKENGRRMMRLAIDINKTHFYYDSTKRPEYLNVITCKTCHQGHPFPPGD